MTTLQVLALDYIIVVYPLVLIAVIYIFIEMHDRNFRMIVWLWNPFHRCFVKFRRGWNIRNSLVDAFATFLLLSYVKFCSVSYDLLTPVQLFDVHGKMVSSTYLYYSGTVEYFGQEHFPYAILAILVVLIFLLLPLILLCVYPCKCFHRLLNHCNLQCRLLHMFMDAFQGCYKDGTNGTYDCRCFAAAYLIVRILLLLLMALNPIIVHYLSLGASLLVAFAILVIVIRPYKYLMYNIIDPILILLLALLHVTVMSSSLSFIRARDDGFIDIVISWLLGSLPIIYLLILLLLRLKILQKIFQKAKSLMSRFRGPTSELEESLPDRLVHAEEYEALLPDPVASGESDRDEREYSSKSDGYFIVRK